MLNFKTCRAVLSVLIVSCDCCHDLCKYESGDGCFIYSVYHIKFYQNMNSRNDTHTLPLLPTHFYWELSHLQPSIQSNPLFLQQELPHPDSTSYLTGSSYRSLKFSNILLNLPALSFPSHPRLFLASLSLSFSLSLSTHIGFSVPLSFLWFPATLLCIQPSRALFPFRSKVSTTANHKWAGELWGQRWCSVAGAGCGGDRHEAT
jgi:hypothetical protein